MFLKSVKIGKSFEEFIAGDYSKRYIFHRVNKEHLNIYLAIYKLLCDHDLIRWINS